MLTARRATETQTYINAIGHREASFRGQGLIDISMINKTLSVQSLDLCDNRLLELTIPSSTSLIALLAAHNRIAKVSFSRNSCPNLQTLVLTGNRLQKLSDLDFLQDLPKLEYLTLIGNPVCWDSEYRLYCVWKQPHIRVLDFDKVRQTERMRSQSRFGVASSETTAGQEDHSKLRQRLLEKLEETDNLEEIEKIEQQLAVL